MPSLNARLNAWLGISMLFKVSAIALLLLGPLCACVSTSRALQTPLVLVAVVDNPRLTDWQRDYCSWGEPVLEPRVTANCLSVGGEIYAATLQRPRTVDGEIVSSRLTVGFPAHALKRSYRRRTDVFVQRAPADFREATGIEYLVTDYDGVLNQSEGCVLERGNGSMHVDYRLCPDPSFHSSQRDCVPLAEALAHYADGR